LQSAGPAALKPRHAQQSYKNYLSKKLPPKVTFVTDRKQRTFHMRDWSIFHLIKLAAVGAALHNE